QDAFSFYSWGESYHIAAVPQLPSGLDLKLEIYDVNGTLLAAADGPTNDQQLNLTLPEGYYYAVVSSHGDYGDLGAYEVTVSAGPGWTTRNVGFVGFAGQADYDYDTGAIRVAGSGSDIWGSADSFRFAYQTLTGDGSITAQVVSQEATDRYAKAGVM